MCLMIEPEWLGGDTVMFILPDGDFITGEVMMVDTTDWSLDEFEQFDRALPSERMGLAKMIDLIHRAEQMSVVEVSLKRGNTPRW